MALTYEKMRADIAQIISVDPSEIKGDDNLMDLGLDSMRAMNLALKWSEEDVTVELSDLAQEPTLNGWWSVISAQLAPQG